MQGTQEFESFISSSNVDVFVQTNIVPFKEKWRKMFSKKQSIDKMAATTSWNWAAFFLSLPWLFYRKMWFYGGIFFALVTALTMLEVATGKQFPGATFVIGIVTAMFGNSWYFQHVYKNVKQAESASTDAANVEAMLKERGGTSWIAAVTATFLFLAVNGGIMFAAEGLDKKLNPEEMSGVWHSDANELIVVSLDMPDMFLAINGTRMPVKVANIDSDNDAINLNVTLQDGSKVMWTLRQNWDKNRERFTLTAILHNGTAHDLGFVRKITSADVPAR